MKISYDKSADAIYIRITAARIKRTVKIQDGLLADLDAMGRVGGIEILQASHWVLKRERSVEIGAKKIPIPAFA